MSNLVFHSGKTPARPDAIEFKLTSYLDDTTKIKVPAVYGHQGLVRSWGMLGNDAYGDCVWAGAGHETILVNREAAHPVSFSETNTLSDYSAVTGFNPNDPNTDQGTDMEVAAAYRRKTGVLDASGTRHLVAAYVDVEKGNLTDLSLASFLFGFVGLGIEFPGSAMDQFNAGQPWDVEPGAEIEGGHYVPLVGRRKNGNFVVVTWGKLQEVTPAFISKYNDETVAYFSTEMLKSNGESLGGFNTTQLQADLAKL